MTESTQVVVIGAGAAGLQAAIHASQQAETLLLTDGAVGRSNSMLAQGGLQVPFDDPSSQKRLLDDMRVSARLPIDEERAARFVASIVSTVRQLEDWGLTLDRGQDGEWRRRLAGGLSEPRIVSASDQIGPAVLKILRHVLSRRPVEVRTRHRVTAIVPEGSGLLLHIEADGSTTELRARAVVVCTGGPTYRRARQLSERTTNLPNQNHLLYDRLAALGLEEVHADCYQYQPFGLVLGDAALDKCVPESVVNFPVRLLDRNGHELGDIHQDRLALSREIVRTANEGRAVTTAKGPGVWLSLSEADPDRLAESFPKLRRLLERHGWVGRDVLVYPFLHYFLGGFCVGTDCQSAVPGLFLAGEMTGGLHGMNRLMGNGFTDSLVHGRVAGMAAGDYGSS